ncbi:hypothetical protein AB9K35_00335 [Leisingera sp. XS_AS12]|uniref:hypothetical protein n=1 Tax=Leisingera sp. XS_AS12 TaxID=3241294 RepID=UPI0035135490
MARPKPDAEKIRARLIAEAEAQLQASDGRRLVLSDLAQRLGMSQSYVHAFYPTKADLVRALVARWFEEVEAASRQAAAAEDDAEARLEQWVLSILRIKRSSFDANPKLFHAYLQLAAGHMDLVRNHVAALRDDLTRIARDMVPEDEVDAAVLVIENATLLFRTPSNIAAYRDRATDASARAVCRLLTGKRPLLHNRPLRN